MADKVIQVNVTSTKSQRVSVSPGNVQNEITATPDSSQYYSNLAKNWAIASGLILNEDYSSKHYAKESANSASNAKNYADASQTTYQNVQQVANTALTDIEDARVDAVDNITTVKSESIASVEAKGNEVVSVVNEGIANIEAKGNEANALVNTGIANINIAKTEAVNAVTTTKNNAVTEINKEVTDGKKELNDIIEAGGSNINDKITNCLLEVPQKIKLELKNGVLTLKTGSRVIVPNGAGVFDEVVITSDKTHTQSANGAITVYYNPAQSKVLSFYSAADASGTDVGSGTSGKTYYDTDDNKISRYDGGNLTYSGLSFPLARVTVSNGAISSIDQVFNGFGYIGSTIWVDKGVKGLIPNGRNEDGSLNNIEVTATDVITRTMTGTGDYYLGVSVKQNLSIIQKVNYEYKETENLMYGSDKAWNNFIFAEASWVSGVISNFQPKLPFRAVDYNEFSNTPHITETYVSGTSWYRIWSPDSTGQRWCEQGGQITANGNSDTTVTLLKNYTNGNYNINLTVRQDGQTGDKYLYYLNLAPSVSSFRIRNSGSSTGLVYWSTEGYLA